MRNPGARCGTRLSESNGHPPSVIPGQPGVQRLLEVSGDARFRGHPTRRAPLSAPGCACYWPPACTFFT
jgi:hypothetical protein